MADYELLKKDLFGEIRLHGHGDARRIVRDASVASPGARWIARWLLRREARVLAALDGLDGVAAIVSLAPARLEREYIEGQPLHRARPTEPAYFRDAANLLRRLHRAGVVHNDLAKEPNLLVRPDGSAAFVDFQLALHAPQRGRIFRLLAWDDIRHLLKHKRCYCPWALTRRERRILDTRSLPSKFFRRWIKPVYLFVTRRILGWADREGAGDRGERR